MGNSLQKINIGLPPLQPILGLCLGIWLILGTTTWAQDGTKRKLEPNEYGLWSTLYMSKVSPQGDWLIYGLKYPDQRDTVFLQRIQQDKKTIKLHFPKGKTAVFSPMGKWYGCMLPNKSLALVDLRDGTQEIISHIKSFQFSNDDRFLIGWKDTDSLVIKDLAKGSEKWLEGVREYSLNPTANTLSYICKTKEIYTLQLTELHSPKKDNRILIKSDLPMYQPKWDISGKALVFLQALDSEAKGNDHYKIFRYSEDNGSTTLKEWMPKKGAGRLKSTYIGNSGIRVRGGGKAIRLYLYQEEEKNSADKVLDQVKVWRTGNTNWSMEDLWEEKRPSTLEAIWFPNRDTTILLNQSENQHSVLTSDNNKLLTFKKAESGPQFRTSATCDILLTDLEKGNSFQILKDQVPSYIRLSPNGGYIAYFRDMDWWIYDLKKQRHRNLTKGLNRLFHIQKNAYSGANEPYGNPGWTIGDKEILVYDQYDIWMIDPLNGKRKRLTDGINYKIEYRIENTEAINESKEKWFPAMEAGEYDLNNTLVLKATGDDVASGYFLRQPNGTMDKLFYGNHYVNGLSKASKKDGFLFRSQSFDLPQSLWYWENSKLRQVVKTNLHNNDFHWGRSKLLHYKGPKGEDLQAALFYPAEFDSKKKYPMVVEIYERKSLSVNKYENPSNLNMTGFNVTNFTTDGYFVLFPDIKYEFNQPGVSALGCVKAGVKAVIEMGHVDRDRIGLIGHSFGGYETSFIVTQSNIFAAAVAGASVTNLISFYHTVGKRTHLPEMWRFEEHQWRFKDSFYKRPLVYFQNSPLHHAGSIKTPLLLWTGGEDYWIDWYQSVELYLGLSRLGGSAELIVYPGERHVLIKKEFQSHLTNRIKEWFDNYLKEKVSLK